MPNFINRYDHIAVDYSKKRSKPWKFFLDFLDIISDINTPEDQIIKGICCDLGCGTGRHQKILTEKADLYIGADLSIKMLEIAKSNVDNKINQQWIQCDIENIPFRPNSISTIVSIAVIHHILSKKRRRKVINKICEIIQQKGFILVSVWGATKGKNSFAIKKAKFRARIRIKEHTFKFWKGRYLKLNKNDILLPWSVISKENKRIEVPRVYHLFNFSELQEFQTPENLNTVLIRSFGNEKTGNNYFLLLKKL